MKPISFYRDSWQKLCVPIGPLFATGSAVIVLRMLLEDLLEPPHQLNYGVTFYENVVDLCHVFLCWWLVILSLACVLAFLLSRPFRNVLTWTIVGLPVILTVPILDSLISGGAGYTIMYQYQPERLMQVIVQMLNPLQHLGGISPGIRIEVILIILGILAFSRLVLQASWFRSVASAIGSYLIIVMWGFLPAIHTAIFHAPHHTPMEIGPFDHHRMLLIPFLFTMALIALRLGYEQKRNLHILLQLLYPSRLIAYGSAYLSGYALARLQLGGNGLSHGVEEALRAGSGLMGVWLLFLSTKLRNDIADLPGDRISNPTRPLVTGEVSEQLASDLSAILWITSLMFMLPVSPNLLLFWFALAAIAHLYVSRHLNVRRMYPFGQMAIALLVITLVLAGSETGGHNISAKILLEHTSLITAIFMLAFLLANMKDFRDMDGDRAAGYGSLPALSTNWIISARILTCFIALNILIIAALTNVPMLPACLILSVYLTVSLQMLRGKPDIHQMDRLIIAALGTIVAFMLLFVYTRIP